jgi:hypothetical protein
METARTVNRNRFLATAQSYEGYTANPDKTNVFGAQTGYNGTPWAGSYVDVIARESGILLPALVYPPAGLQVFERTRKIRRFSKPQPGDLVFYAFPTDGDFSVPHVGIVTDTEHYRTYGVFKALEGQTATGYARGNQAKNGVYTRIRYEMDVLAFVKVDFHNTVILEPNESAPTVSLAQVTSGKNPEAVEIVQTALASLGIGREFRRGTWNALMTSAYAAWQRQIGFVSPTGKPTMDDLLRLGRETGHFNAVD